MLQDIYKYLSYTANLIAQTPFQNKLILKGGSVLISKLIECGRMDLYRLTSDLDIHCDKIEVWIDFYTNIENILNQNNAGYIYKITKRRSATEGLIGSDSLEFEIDDNGIKIKFKMDMNIKSNSIITVDYSPILNMQTYDAYTMLADKVVSVSSRVIYRRIKDLYDIAVLASIYDFNYSNVMQHIKVKHPNAELNNMLIPDNYMAINHAYEKFEGILNKPDIRYLISICSTFLHPIYLRYKGDLTWSTQRLMWESH